MIFLFSEILGIFERKYITICRNSGSIPIATEELGWVYENRPRKGDSPPRSKRERRQECNSWHAKGVLWKLLYILQPKRLKIRCIIKIMN